MNTYIFTSFDQYEAWTEQFEDACEYQEIPTAIDDGWKVAVDMFTACKSYKTALRRFEKAFKDVNPGISAWVEGMRESAENGYFKDECKPGWNCTKEEREEFYKGGTYSYGIEETSEGYWYIFLNISGIFAGRERAEA